MKLLMLNGPSDPRGDNPLYKGTNKAQPTYEYSLPDTHEINVLFLWYSEEGGESGVVSNPQKAMQYCKLLNAVGTQGSFAVIEVTDEYEKPSLDGVFLGFDLSAWYIASLLRYGFRRFPAIDAAPFHIRELSNLVARHYAPLLNENGLFQISEVASQCKRSMMAMTIVSPHLYEGGTLEEYRPVGVFAISG